MADLPLGRHWPQGRRNVVCAERTCRDGLLRAVVAPHISRSVFVSAGGRDGSGPSERAALGYQQRLCLVALFVCAGLGVSRESFAQTDRWEVDFAPLYLWAATTDGNVSEINGTKNIPIYLDFADAKSKLAGAFSVSRRGPQHGRWGVLGDVNFLRPIDGCAATRCRS